MSRQCLKYLVIHPSLKNKQTKPTYLNLHYPSIRYDKFRFLVFLKWGCTCNTLYVTLFIKSLAYNFTCSQLTFSFFLCVSNGCLAAALRGVRTTSSSATSMVRPFGCTATITDSVIKLLGRANQRFVLRTQNIQQSNSTPDPN